MAAQHRDVVLLVALTIKKGMPLGFPAGFCTVAAGALQAPAGEFGSCSRCCHPGWASPRVDGRQ